MQQKSRIIFGSQIFHYFRIALLSILEFFYSSRIAIVERVITIWRAIQNRHYIYYEKNKFYTRARIRL